MHFRVQVMNLRSWFTEVEAASEREARAKALAKAKSWKDLHGRERNPDAVTGSVIQFWPKEEEAQ